jgi:hypothetical protein
MRKLLPPAGAFLTIVAVTQSIPVIGQDASAFADVPTSSWVYHAAADLQQHHVITGWPADYFAGKRTLTRYEFAIALKRALDKLTYSDASINDDSAGANEPQITPELLNHVRELVAYFKPDLVTLHTDLSQVNDHLTRLIDRLRQKETPSSGMPDMLRPGRLDAGLLAPVRPGFDLMHSGAPLSMSLPSGAPGPLLPSPATRSAFPFPVGRPDSLTAPFGAALAGQQQGRAFGDRSTNLNLDVPLTERSAVGLSLYDTLVSDNLLTAAPYRTLGYGTSVNLQPSGHLTLGAAASRNILERFNQDGSAASVQDANTYLLNVAYKSGPASAVLGYRLTDPTAVSGVGSWTGSLLGISPTTTMQGPYTRIALQLSDRLQSYIGGDYYGNTGLRGPDFGNGLATNPMLMMTGNIYRGTAGIRWNPSRRISLTADYEGVLYDISGANNAFGRRFQPVEQYFTLGAGLNLSRNAILRMAYQIYNQQDASGAGDSPFSQSTGSTSVFTTQLAVHF